MENRTFKHIMIWLLIASPVWWTSGCYTTREFTKLDEVNCEIEVVTKNKRTYTFTAWTYDSLKGISGDAHWLVESISPWDDSEDHYGRLALPRDDIRTIALQGDERLPVDGLQTFKPKKTVEIHVTTRGNNVYSFKAWKPDGHGGISGDAEWFEPSSPSWHSDYVQGRTNLPRDSIKNVVRREYSSGRTILTVVGATLGVLCLILWAVDPRWIPEGRGLIN
jgi:hypothetical protein